MPAYSFPGYPVFLQAAAREIGRPEAEVPARRIAALGSVANLCAQAGGSEAGSARAILAKADEFRDQLLAAYRASELMIAEVRGALGLDPEPAPEVAAVASPRGAGARNPRR